MKKIAFCFLVYDHINHEELWNIFFKGIDSQKYSIHVHYKHDVQLKYFNNNKLASCIPTQHGHISLIKAQNLLFEEALKDENTTHCIIVSNSCIPFKSFDKVYEFLDINYSYINQGPKSQCFPRCNSVCEYISSEYIEKSSQWCILNRKHANIMINHTDYIQWFEKISFPDEHSYITKLNTLNLLNEVILTPNLANDATTFTNWEGMDYKYVSTNDLKNYSSVSKEEVLHLLNSKCLFGRKFNKECISDLIIKEYIDNITSK